MGNKFITITTALIFSSNVYAGSLSVKIDGQTVTAKVCSMSTGAKNVTFKMSEKGYAQNGIAQSPTSMENGCAIKVYSSQPSSLIQKGVEVIANYTRADGTLWQASQSSGGGVSTPTTPVGTPRPGTPTPTPMPTIPQAPEKKVTEDAKVRTYAVEAANFMANRVVEKFGRVENFRYSFFKGFNDRKRFYSDLGVSATALPEYSNERAKGVAEGNSNGLRLGGNEGTRAGSQQGEQEGRNRFQRALNNPAALDVTTGSLPSGSEYRGLQGDKIVPGFSQMLNEYNDVFLQEVKRFLRLETDFDDDIVAEIFGNYWGLSSLYEWNDYQYDTVFSKWKAENAFTLFLNRKLVREGSDPNKVEANNRMVTKYKEIINSEEYSDADQSKSLFYNTFINQYNNVIGQKWRSEVYGQVNQEAASRGGWYFIEAAKEYARRMGYAHGFNPAFNSASIAGYRQNIGPAFKGSFDNTVAYYSSHPVIENVQVAVKNLAGQTSVAVLDSIYPTIIEATNFGKEAGNVEATLSGPGLAQLPAEVPLMVNVPGLTRVLRRLS